MCTYIEKVQKFSRVMEWDTVEIDNMVDPMIEFVRGALNILKINEQILTKEQMISLFNQINNKNFSVIKENEFLLNYNFEQKQAFKHIEKTSRYPQESWKNLPFALRVAVFYCFCRYYEQEKKAKGIKKKKQYLLFF